MHSTVNSLETATRAMGNAQLLFWMPTTLMTGTCLRDFWLLQHQHTLNWVCNNSICCCSERVLNQISQRIFEARIQQVLQQMTALISLVCFTFSTLLKNCQQKNGCNHLPNVGCISTWLIATLCMQHLGFWSSNLFETHIWKGECANEVGCKSLTPPIKQQQHTGCGRSNCFNSSHSQCMALLQAAVNVMLLHTQERPLAGKKTTGYASLSHSTSWPTPGRIKLDCHSQRRWKWWS